MCTLNYSHYITVGDFNLPDIDWEYCTTNTETSDLNFELIECLRDCFWHQHILEPTRARGDATPSILDLIISNEEGMVSDVLIQNPIGKSDHSTISFTFHGHTKSNSTNLKRDYNKADYESMKAMLDINWEELLENKCVEEQWTLLSSKIDEAIKKYVPIKKVSNNFSSKGNVPVSHKLKKLIRRKEKLWKKFRITGDRPAHEDYKKVRNQVRRLSRKAVKLKEKDIAMSAKENPKKFWSYVKSKSKTKTSIADLYTDESKTTLTDSDEAKANVLGNFFSSVFTIEPEDLLPELNLKNIPVINEIEINLDIVKKKLDALLINKSSGPDGLSARVLKEMSDVIAVPVHILFKNSLQTGSIPKIWKTANITAIYKKGDKKFAGNYIV